MIRYEQCPACGSNTIQKQLEVKDYTVSEQCFEIWECSHCRLRFTQNVPDQSQIGAFYKSENYISHTETKKGLINRLYHFIRKVTIRSKRRLILNETKIKQGSILDIGAGTGLFLKAMRDADWRVSGIEPDDLARSKAQELYGVLLLHPDVLFEFGSHTFNAITLWHVLEHVHDLHSYLTQINKLLAKNGVLFIAVPNYTCYDAQTYQQYWAAYDVPRHLYHFSPQSIRVLLEQHGMILKKIKPMWFDSFYIAMLSEKNKSLGRGNTLKAFWNGLWSNCIALTNKGRCSSIIYIIQKKDD